MGRYEGHKTTLKSALHGGLYLAKIMDRYLGPLTSLIIDLQGGLYLANIKTVMDFPTLPLL
jgi:hypothetical protein